ncbi:HIPA PROTEIN [hydrothermal vent metagenome]|uniref:HIPA PROTEIN n=1 Tax=hydrothermal vent metagenome TaxID=652676 RepID=A0A3B1ADJ9_9ZZZZ
MLIERFDRVQVQEDWQRKAMVSGLTLLGLNEMMARYASYEDFAEIIRHRFRSASTTLKELFSRLVFNILCGNTDDHARNHAAFWDGDMLCLTPANEATQAMLISGDNRMSQLNVCLEAAQHFLLSRDEAGTIIKQQIEVVEANWSLVCDEANLSEMDRALFWKRQFLNPFALQGFIEA